MKLHRKKRGNICGLFGTDQCENADGAVACSSPHCCSRSRGACTCAASRGYACSARDAPARRWSWRPPCSWRTCSGAASLRCASDNGTWKKQSKKQIKFWKKNQSLRKTIKLSRKNHINRWWQTAGHVLSLKNIKIIRKTFTELNLMNQTKSLLGKIVKK